MLRSAAPDLASEPPFPVARRPHFVQSAVLDGRLNWTLEGETPAPDLRKPFDVLAGAMSGGGDGKVTRLELFAAGVLESEPNIIELIRAAA